MTNELIFLFRFFKT